MKRSLALVTALAASALAVVPAATGHGRTGGGPQAGSEGFKPLLPVLGFDSLGAPSTGSNTEITLDVARRYAYVGSLDFEIFETGNPAVDPSVKTVDVSDPARPTMTDQDPPLGGDLGTWDVTVAGDILAASGQGTPPSNPGITLYSTADPANPVAVSHIGNAELKSPFGSHTNYLWRDPLTGRTWLFANGLDFVSMMIFDVTNPAVPQLKAEYDNPGIPFDAGFVHDSFVQAQGGRVLSYQSGVVGLEIVDVSRIVRGGETGELTEADVVGFNYYTAGAFGIPVPGVELSPPVTRPMFSHYPEPTASGRVTWVGDEAGCGEPAILHGFDTSGLPLPPAKKPLPELGVIVETPDAPMCSGFRRSEAGWLHGRLPQLNDFRWTGHNFDVVGEDLLVRADYGRGVYAYDISDPADPGWVAKSRGLTRLVGDENRADPGRDRFGESYPLVWAAQYDPLRRLIFASDINQGLYSLALEPK